VEANPQAWEALVGGLIIVITSLTIAKSVFIYVL
jgi:hypothetical protein